MIRRNVVAIAVGTIAMMSLSSVAVAQVVGPIRPVNPRLPISGPNSAKSKESARGLQDRSDNRYKGTVLERKKSNNSIEAKLKIARQREAAAKARLELAEERLRQLEGKRPASPRAIAAKDKAPDAPPAAAFTPKSDKPAKTATLELKATKDESGNEVFTFEVEEKEAKPEDQSEGESTDAPKAFKSQEQLVKDAEAAVAKARQAAIAPLLADPDFAAEYKSLEKARSQLAAAKAKNPPDRAKVAQSAMQILKSERVVKKPVELALNRDQQYQAASQALRDARAGKRVTVPTIKTPEKPAATAIASNPSTSAAPTTRATRTNPSGIDPLAAQRRDVALARLNYQRAQQAVARLEKMAKSR